jgi:chromosome partitioning protein
MAHKIFVYNRKGGVGKSSASLAIAGELSMTHEKKILLIDFDSTANLTNGIAHSEAPEMWFAEMILSYYDDEIKEDLHDAIVPTEFPNIDLMPSNSKAMTKAERGLPRIPEYNPAFILNEFLEDIEDEYDYIIIDSAQGSANEFNQIGMNAADYILSPTDDNIDGLDGFQFVLSRIEAISKAINPDIQCLGVFLNRVNSSRSLGKMIAAKYKELFPDHFIPIIVRDSAAVGRARITATPLCYYDKKEKVAGDFRELTDYIVEKVEGGN